MPHTFTHTAHTILYLSFDTLAHIYFTTLTALSCLFEAAVVSLVLECLRCYLHFCANFLQFRFAFCLSAYFILVSLLASVLLLFSAVFLPSIFLLSAQNPHFNEVKHLNNLCRLLLLCVFSSAQLSSVQRLNKSAVVGECMCLFFV